MKYVVTKRYKKQSMSNYMNLPYGTEIENRDGVLYYNDMPLCYITSQDAYDYFSYNGDGNGLERGKLITKIMSILGKPDDQRQDRWNKLWDDKDVYKYRRKDIEDYWLWGLEFYRAPIDDLKYILEKIQNID